jgi:hypothetical protein
LGLIRQSKGEIVSRVNIAYNHGVSHSYKGYIRLWDNGLECWINDLDRMMVVGDWGVGVCRDDIVEVRIEGSFRKHLSLYVRISEQRNQKGFELKLPQEELIGWKKDIEAAIRKHRARARTCPDCGGPLAYIQQYYRWYCDREQKYI